MLIGLERLQSACKVSKLLVQLWIGVQNCCRDQAQSRVAELQDSTHDLVKLS